MKTQTILAAIALLVLPLSAQELAVPDFSKGMPGVNLERKEKINGQETFYLKTALGYEKFFTTVKKFLGEGWNYQEINRKKMIIADNKWRTSNAASCLGLFQNAKVPGVDILVIHLKRKEEKGAGFSVEIVVVRKEED